MIGGAEQQMAKAYGDIKPGQVSRNNNKGKIVVTNGVTSNVIDQKKAKEYDEKQRTFNPFAQD